MGWSLSLFSPVTCPGGWLPTYQYLFFFSSFLTVFRTAAPFREQTGQILSNFSPKTGLQSCKGVSSLPRLFFCFSFLPLLLLLLLFVSFYALRFFLPGGSWLEERTPAWYASCFFPACAADALGIASHCHNSRWRTVYSVPAREHMRIRYERYHS